MKGLLWFLFLRDQEQPVARHTLPVATGVDMFSTPARPPLRRDEGGFTTEHKQEMLNLSLVLDWFTFNVIPFLKPFHSPLLCRPARCTAHSQ